MPIVPIQNLKPLREQWLWAAWLADGHLAIVDGDPGIGKSLVTLDLCARITTGRAFPDGAAGGDPSAVIVINAEDGAGDTIQGRLHAAGADLTRVHIYERTPGESFLRLPGHLKRLEDALVQTGARYIVLDPITSFLDGDVNVASDTSVRAALGPLADLARRHQCVIHLVRHLNKSAGQNALYRGLYSIGFIACCRVAWLIACDPHHCRRYVLSQIKNNLNSPPASLAYTIESGESGVGRIAWLGKSPYSQNDLLAGAPARLRHRRRAQEFLLAFLKDGPRTTLEIWDAARPQRFSRRSLDRARDSLGIQTRRINNGTPMQTNYWLLPGQEVPGHPIEPSRRDEALKTLQGSFVPRTPLDDDYMLPEDAAARDDEDPDHENE